MFSIYKNPQAKVGLKWLLGISISFLTVIFMVYHWLIDHIHYTLNHHAAHLYVLNQHNIALEPYVKNGIFPDTLRGEVAKLMQQSFTQKIDTSMYTAYLFLSVCIWCLFTITAFFVMSLYFKRFFNRLNRFNDYILTLHSDVVPIDIRQSNEGVLSQLEHSLYQTATALHTQYQVSKGHKDYLDANIANISHQLKTPLTALWVVSDSILALPIEQRTDDKLLPLEPQLQRIDTLIQSLLLMTRLDAHAITFKKEPIILSTLLTQLHHNFDTLLHANQVELQVIGKMDTHIHVDKFYIYEALSNILKNAIDHATPHTTIQIKIQTNIFYTSISIENTGLPIDNDDLPYIFKRFYKGKNAKTNSIGIGLSLAYEIINQHDGKLSAKNTSDGVQFEMTLPQ